MNLFISKIKLEFYTGRKIKVWIIVMESWLWKDFKPRLQIFIELISDIMQNRSGASYVSWNGSVVQ